MFTFILGGLIGVVQKSGGGIGMARLLYRFTSTRRRSVVCSLSVYTDILIVCIIPLSWRVGGF